MEDVAETRISSCTNGKNDKKGVCRFFDQEPIHWQPEFMKNQSIGDFCSRLFLFPGNFGHGLAARAP
jgi:hypothetical protein